MVYEEDQTAELVIDGDLITGKHPGMIEEFVKTFVEQIEA